MLRQAFCMLLLGCGAGAAAEPASAAWTGRIVYRAELVGAPASGTEQPELRQYLAHVEHRRRTALGRVPGAPRAVLRILREDIAFLDAELQRINETLGGRIQLGDTDYLIAGPRLRKSTESGQLLIDRSAGTARSFVARIEFLALAPLPTPTTATGPAGAPFRDHQQVHATVRFETKLGDHAYRVDIVPGLPNPFALELLVGTDDLSLALAQFPGLPVLIEMESKQCIRRLAVLRMFPGPVDDASFSFDR